MVAEFVVTVGTAPDAVDISCLVDDVAINHGRSDTNSQPEASSATVSFTTSPDDPLPPVVDVGAAVTVTAHTTGTYARFSGRVTDVTLGWEDNGPDTPDSGVGQLVAIGLLADLGRHVVGEAPYPQELDGARVARVLAAAGVVLNPATSDPGKVQILPRDIDSQPALDVAQNAAQSANGIVWETRAGEIRYADADHRRNAVPNLVLDACNVLVTPTWQRTIQGLVNDVSIGYGVPPEGEDQPRYVATSDPSIARYGRYAMTATTELAELADAQAMGQLLLVRNSSPVWIMAVLPVDVKGLTAAEYDALLGLDVHGLITLTGLPAIGTAPTSAALWVEGWTERLAWADHTIELVVSGYCRTVPAPRWDDLAPTLTWDTVAPTLTWDDATCLGPPVNFGRWNDVPATLRWNQVPPATTWDTWH
jgi:hypothetical protein